MNLRTVAAAFLMLAPNLAWSADAVVGTWKTQEGELSLIERCGDNFCIVAKSGKYVGQKIGSFKRAGDTYAGRITDPRNKATYSGRLTLSGDNLKLRGCATAVLCKTQIWVRAR